MRVLLSLTFIFAVFTSCAPEPEVQKTKISIGANAATTLFPGGIYIAGRMNSSDPSKRFLFSRRITSNNSISLELPNGKWDFVSFGWKGNEPMTGEFKCFSLNGKELVGEETSLNITLTTSNCGDSFFGESALKDESSQPLPATFDRSGYQSHQLVLFDLEVNTKKVIMPGSAFRSLCNTVSAPITFPAFTDFPFRIRSFINNDCTDEFAGTNFNMHNIPNYGVAVLDGSNIKFEINSPFDPIQVFSVNESGDEESLINVVLYNNNNGLKNAVNCTVSSINEAEITLEGTCECTEGKCTQSLKGASNFAGSTTFVFNITNIAGIDSSEQASITLNNIDDVPVASNIAPPAFNEDTVSTITLSYTDPDGDEASSCSLSELNNVTIATACSCVSGACTVGIKGTLNYFGNNANFKYTVVANGKESNKVMASLNITPVDDEPTITNPTLVPGTPLLSGTSATFDLGFADVDSNIVTSCDVVPSTINSPRSGQTVTFSTSTTDGDGANPPSCTVVFDIPKGAEGNLEFSYTIETEDQENAGNTLSTTSLSFSFPIVTQIAALDIEAPTIKVDERTVVPLGYFYDESAKPAATCSLSNFSQVSVDPTSVDANGNELQCQCNNGLCTAFIKGDNAGSATFQYIVANEDGVESNLATVSMNVSATLESDQKMMSIWKTTSSNEEIKLPLPSGSTYNFEVVWGNILNDAQTISSPTLASKVYKHPGFYQILINQDTSPSAIPQWSFGQVPHSKDKIVTVDSFGDLGWVNLQGGFKGALSLIYLKRGDVSSITSMASMFEGATNFKILDGINWNTQSVTNMSSMFKGTTLEELLRNPNGLFNAQATTNLSQMFYSVKSTNPNMVLNLQNFVSNGNSVNNLSSMFKYADINRIDLGFWRLEQPANLSLMFYHTNTNQLDINNWTVTSTPSSSSDFDTPDNTSNPQKRIGNLNCTNADSLSRSLFQNTSCSGI